MLKVYLDNNYVCHLTNNSTYRVFYTDFFSEDSPEEYVEGYRIIPDGESWTREDGIKFYGYMITPAVDFDGLTRVQKQHEIDDNKFTEQLGALIDEIYNEDLEVIG